MNDFDPVARALVRWFVGIHAAVFVAFGLVFLAAPEALGALLGIRLESAVAVADFRAMYGGLSLGTGLLFAVSIRRDTWLTPSLFTIGATSGCLALGRLMTALSHGKLGAPIYVFSAMEIASFLLAVFLLTYPTTRTAAGARA
jgi:hypothetical protein